MSHSGASKPLIRPTAPADTVTTDVDAVAATASRITSISIRVPRGTALGARTLAIRAPVPPESAARVTVDVTLPIGPLRQVVAGDRAMAGDERRFLLVTKANSDEPVLTQEPGSVASQP